MKTRTHSLEPQARNSLTKGNVKAIWLSGLRRFWNAFLAGAGYGLW
ncbi:MAG: hypothetical protein HY735_35560 [Verrucomicrobia bacterium]|nr:hypothetical protein [Verrucomicrobiota bacterium]